MPQVTVATFNIHAGIDGLGRPFDLSLACRQLDADVILLQEAFAPDDAPSQAVDLATEIGYESVELPLSRAWKTRQPTGGGPHWQPRRPYPRSGRALRIGAHVRSDDPSLPLFEAGTWGLAILSRAGLSLPRSIELGKLPRDFTYRGALGVTLDSGLEVWCTHVAHSTHGSPFHLRRLRHGLPDKDVPAVLGGDMNFWGPPVELLMPGWKRTARGRTWPSWRRLHQLDHLLVTDPVRALDGGVVLAGNSDHLPLRATLAW